MAFINCQTFIHEEIMRGRQRNRHSLIQTFTHTHTHISLMFTHLTNLQLFIITLYFNWIVWLHFFPTAYMNLIFKWKLDLIFFKYLFELWLIDFLRSFFVSWGSIGSLRIVRSRNLDSLVYKEEALSLMYRLRRDSYSCFLLFSWHENLK